MFDPATTNQSGSKVILSGLSISSFSISFDMKLSAGGNGNQYTFELGDVFSFNRSSNGSAYFNGTAGYVTISDPIVTNTWQAIQFTFDSSGAQFLVDGTLKASLPTQVHMNSFSNFMILAEYNSTPARSDLDAVGYFRNLLVVNT